MRDSGEGINLMINTDNFGGSLRNVESGPLDSPAIPKTETNNSELKSN